MKPIRMVIVFLVTLFAGGLTVFAFHVPADPQFAILCTTDFHGYLEPDDKGHGGAAYLAGAIRDVRQQVGEQNVLLLDSGDIFLAGPPISQLLQGESAVDIFNLLGYDGATIGNHEFDAGQRVLLSRTLQANWPWIAANLVITGTDWERPAWVRPYITKTLGGQAGAVVVGVIGLANPETPALTVRSATEGLAFLDPVQAVSLYYDEIRAQVDFLIVLAHIGLQDSGPYPGLRTIARQLADMGRPADLMLAGHTHEPLFAPVWVGPTPIVQAGFHGRWLGRADFEIDSSVQRIRLKGYRLVFINNSITADDGVAGRVAYWAEMVQPIIARPVGVTAVSLTRKRDGESNLGNLVADAMRWKADEWDDGQVNGSVEAALTNPGGLRYDIVIPSGASRPYTITWGQTYQVLPFGNTLYVMDLTGAQLQILLNRSASLSKGMLQTAGLTWQWHNNCVCETPSRWGALDIRMNGEPLQADHVYHIVTNSFLATGGDNWPAFGQAGRPVDTYIDQQEAVNDYLQWFNATIGPITHTVEGRIRLVRAYPIPLFFR